MANGGKLGLMSDHHINIPSNNYGQVEDLHLMLEHMIVSALQDQVKDNLPLIEDFKNIRAQEVLT